jgi:hypothetical protein
MVGVGVQAGGSVTSTRLFRVRPVKVLSAPLGQATLTVNGPAADPSPLAVQDIAGVPDHEVETPASPAGWVTR